MPVAEAPPVITPPAATYEPAVDLDATLAARALAGAPARAVAPRLAALDALAYRLDALPATVADLSADEKARRMQAAQEVVLSTVKPDEPISAVERERRAAALVANTHAADVHARTEEEAAALQRELAAHEQQMEQAHRALLEPVDDAPAALLPDEEQALGPIDLIRDERLLIARSLVEQRKTQRALADVAAAVTLNWSTPPAALLFAAEHGSAAERRQADKILVHWSGATEDDATIRRQHQSIVQARIPASLRTAMAAERAAFEHLAGRIRSRLTAIAAIRRGGGGLVGAFTGASAADVADAQRLQAELKAAWGPVAALARKG
jgi:hypothetical protein